MIESLSIEFWIAVLFFLNFFLVIFSFFIVRKMNRINTREPEHQIVSESEEKSEYVSDSARKIISMLEPLVEESQKAAISFDKQVKEKKRLLKELNDALDSRIISINLLLSRADALQKKIQAEHKEAMESFVFPVKSNLLPPSNPVLDQQNQIIQMYLNKIDIDTIARQLAIPKGEVQLVIDLKNKFLAMEKDNR